MTGPDREGGHATGPDRNGGRATGPDRNGGRVTSRSYGPEVGAGKRWLGGLHFTGVLWYRLPMLGVRIVPDWLKPPLLNLFTALFWLLLTSPRRAIARNLQAVLGPAGVLRGWARSYRTLRNFAWCLTERYEQFLPKRSMQLDPDIPEGWPALRARDDGLLFVTAHFGGWEMAGMASFGGDPPDTVHAVREQELDPRADAWFKKRLAALGGPRLQIHYSQANPTLGVELLAAVRDGGWVAMQGDRPPTDGKSVPVEFFGRTVDFSTGPGLLARLSGAPLIPVFMVRTGRRRYRLVMREPIEVPHTADRDADIRATMQSVAGELERMVRAHPHQWFCLRDVMRARPA